MLVEKIYKWNSVVGVQVAVDISSKSQRVNPCGEMNEVKRLYGAEGWPALSAGGHDKYLIGYFTSDTGDLHQLIHLWKFESDENRRAFWAKLFADEKFISWLRKL